VPPLAAPAIAGALTAGAALADAPGATLAAAAGAALTGDAGAVLATDAVDTGELAGGCEDEQPASNKTSAAAGIRDFDIGQSS
jgi:hypothetical protein